jgi:tetratricopeptide (TPR) repeat protein/tRNA A-37 threonylcarbamoyl transferase component Bud32
MIGQLVSHYKITGKIGEGGMGIVYKAQDTKLKRDVALKFLPPELTRDAHAKKRFIREAQTISSLDHPNICTVYEIDETRDGQLFIAMACYKGRTLKEKLKDGRITIEEAVNISIQVIQGLAKAHKQGIIHRDIKPANIFITEDGVVKILDFGLAKLYGQSSITKDYTLLGTVSYLSPEQASGGKADGRTDIWSTGVILYEMVTGQLPFKGDIDQVLIYSILHEDPAPPTTVNPLIPSELETVILKALQKDPGNRYQHIEYMERDLRKTVSEDTSDYIKTPEKKSGIPFNTRTKLIGSLALILLLLLLVFLVIKPGNRKKISDIKPIPVAVTGFKNMTGNEAYNYLQEAIPNLLITSLEQSPYLNVTTWERMYDLLEQIDKKDIEFINKDIGFDLCRLDGINVIITGSYAKADNLFITDVKVLDVTTKEIIKSATSQGEGVASILKNQIDELSKEIALGIGLSGIKIKSAQIELAEVTTTSMEAYRNFLYGREKFEKSYWEDALPFLQKAVEEDSTFSMAYLYLALTYDILYYSKESWQALNKAKKYSYKATEKERLYIDEGINRYNPEKRYKILSELAEKYPKEKRVQCKLGDYYLGMMMHDKAVKSFKNAIDLDQGYGSALKMLARTYMYSGDYDLAIETQEKYMDIFPGGAEPLVGLGDIYFHMGRLNDAITNYEKAIQIKPLFYEAYLKISYCHGLMEDYKEAEKWIGKYKKHVQSDAPSSGEAMWWAAYYQRWQGQYDMAIKSLEEVKTLGRELTVSSGTAIAELLMGYCYYEKKDFNTSQFYFKNAFKEFTSYGSLQFPTCYNFCRGIIELEHEQFDSVYSRLDEILSLLPEIKSKLPWCEETVIILYRLLKAEVLLKEGQVRKSISMAEKISLSQIPAIPSFDFIFYNLPANQDVLARAYQRAGEPDKAIKEYEKLTSFNPDSKDRRLIHPLYYYKLAILYQEKGQTDKALLQYKLFLEQWKDADKDLPELIEAKKNYKLLSAKKNL